MNWLDLVILFIIIVGAAAGARRGFLRGALDLALVLIGLLAGAVGYRLAAKLLGRFWETSDVLINVVAFALVALVVQGILSLVIGMTLGPAIGLARRFPIVRGVDELLGIVPGALKAAVLVTMLLLVGMLVPLGATAQKGLSNSGLTPVLVSRAMRVMTWAEGRTGLNLADFTITTVPRPDEGIELPYRVTDGLVEQPSAEAEMLELVNQERQQRGLAPLQMDPALQAVARAHSREMFELGYFAHHSPVTGSPADRLQAAGIRYAVAGENLAYAPTVAVAHRSLMQSPGHRENILSAEFTRVGIGVIEAPTGAKMFTQEFAAG